MKLFVFALGIAVMIISGLFAMRHAKSPKVSKEYRAYIDSQVTPAIEKLKSTNQIEPIIIERLSADPVTRNAIQLGLINQGRGNLFPEKYRTMEADAESRVASLFLQKTGNIPREIELVKKYNRERSSVQQSFFFFRFHVDSNTDGKWRGALIGPYSPDQKPETVSLSFTFSIPPFDDSTQGALLNKIEALVLHDQAVNFSHDL